jgi:hypothetical protein
MILTSMMIFFAGKITKFRTMSHLTISAQISKENLLKPEIPEEHLLPTFEQFELMGRP